MTRAVRIAGGVALLIAALQLGQHFRRGEAWQNLWACNLAPLAVGLGCLALRPLPLAVGVCWLSLGTTLWLVALAGGDETTWTSALSHVGVLAIGVLAALRLGWPRRAWFVAVLAFLALIAACRLLSPPALNLNLAFAVYPGWERLFPSHAVYLGLLVVLGSAAFAGIERAMRAVAR